ncbi:tetratricopeptide repeat protein [Streptomyces sp. NPDC020766]
MGKELASGSAGGPGGDPAGGSVGRPADGSAGGSAKRRTLAGVVVGCAVVGCAVLGGVLMVAPPGRGGPSPAPGPVARAETAVGAGTPASLPDLVALIGDREAHLRAHPGDVRSWAVLGAAYAERGERTGDARFYPKAEKALRTSLRAKPKKNVEAFDGLAALANDRHDFRAARKWGEASVAASPKRWTAYPALIDAYRGLGEFKAADKALARLVRLPKGAAAPRARVLTRAALVYRDQGQREDAAAALWDAVALASAPAERADCLVGAGELAWERGEPAESLRAFEAAVRADPDGHAALAGQGRALAALGRTPEAVSAYRAASEKRALPQYAWELGELYESLGMGGEARAEYDVVRTRVREGAAGGVNSALVAGLFEADHGDPEAAVRLLREEWERHPSAAVADALGWALHRAGQHQDALVFATKATDRQHVGAVRSAPHAYHRGMIERQLKLEGPARRHLEEALRVNPYFSPLGVPVAKEALGALGSV